MFKNVVGKNNISLDNICYFIKKPYETLCFCAELPVQRNEFFSAGQSDIRSECVLLVDSESYRNDTVVKYNGIVYKAYRAYPRADGFTELYLTEKIGVK